MMARMSPEQLDGWLAFDAIEPIGPRGLWGQLANAMHVYFSSVGVESKFAELLPGMSPEELE